ncbi:MAG: aminotransferase class V-fold PLP-dependent enzyme [Clostridiales bacterium]|nr:aminotransferase class V-fold PLP-dependent enzyme [Clostridiales bacterium]
MIYFDNAATTLVKPDKVYKALYDTAKTAANPGRGGYPPSMKASEIVYSCREEAARFFNVKEPERVIFTTNATHALNIAIKGAMADGGHAVISGYEHNSVYRPITAMSENHHIYYSIADAPLFKPRDIIQSFIEQINENTRYVICNHVSNVFGYILPIYEIDELCASRGIGLIIDAAQSAGVVKLDAGKLKACEYICMPGHKGLYGPQGTGMMICTGDKKHQTLIEGGTGSLSNEAKQPGFLPDRFESGTLNVPGIAGLLEGLRFVVKTGADKIHCIERILTKQLIEGLYSIPNIEVFASEDPALQSAVVSFRGKDGCEEISEYLASEGICVRAGLHCSPLAHKNANTYNTGTVRVSFSYFNTKKEVDKFLHILNQYQSKKKN